MNGNESMPHGVGGPRANYNVIVGCELVAEKKKRNPQTFARGMFFTRDPVERIMLTLETFGFAKWKEKKNFDDNCRNLTFYLLTPTEQKKL